jgi:hypothetical protein
MKVEDLEEIIGRGIMFTPTHIIDSDEKAIGKVPGVGVIIQIFKGGG